MVTTIEAYIVKLYDADVFLKIVNFQKTKEMTKYKYLSQHKKYFHYLTAILDVQYAI